MGKRILLMGFCLVFLCIVRGENGYDLWLRYEKINDVTLRTQYRSLLAQLVVGQQSPTIKVAKDELKMALQKMLQMQITETSNTGFPGSLIIGTLASPAIAKLSLAKELAALGEEGFFIRTVSAGNHTATVIAANKDIGVLYGVFRLLELMQTHQSIVSIAIKEIPQVKLRVLNHWDNLNGTIERGYAGGSIWNWQQLPGIIDRRYIDYARANASVGINGAVLNNVNANAKSLTKEYLIKTAALADALRPYGVKVYLTARFSAPKEIGGLKTADPLDAEVIKWWANKATEVYHYIPDFGGFLVKANSEGQPGPGDYKRTHADGANTIARALAPHGGVLMWRAFVYENKKGSDRAKQAYNEFQPLDGKFDKNVLLQPKYGPIDFQPREAYHPLFGAMPKTPLVMEFQLTQEYFGFATHLVYLGSLFKEYLQQDTYAKGEGSTIAKVISGELEEHALSGIAGVSNMGSDVNWTGHPFAQSNWYAFGKFAWNPGADESEVADNWVRMTFSNDQHFLRPVKKLMLGSRETAVDYMTPMGLNHIMNFATHYGPGPWYKDPNWDAWDYHHADSVGLGVDRTATGSNAIAQYYQPLSDSFGNIKTVPINLLLWFHHVPWDHIMPSGDSFWNELVMQYYKGVAEVKEMQLAWDRVEGMIDQNRFQQVKHLLTQQGREAEWWRDGCVLYFQSFSHKKLPAGCARPAHLLSYYKSIPFPGY
ncbi:MAG: Xylan alpha,2-glucuronidase [Ferruginibacter sp.]|nr:Xylan alpha,2-glucuronidase [Ferruginibacter sp.]